MLETQSIEKIIESLPCESIPDTRALQRIRLETAGKLDWFEKQIKKYKDEAQEPYKNHFLNLWNEPRIARLSEEDQRKIYSLAIPLTFPLGDHSAYDQDKNLKTRFSRFQGHFCGNNALHLTTKEGFNEIIKVFVNNNIPVRLGGDTWQIWTPFRKLFREYPAIEVPFKFCEQKLLYHSFATPEQDVMARPFWYVEELSLSHNTDEIIRTFLAQADEKRYYVDSHFFSRKHRKQPEQYIPEYIEERTKSKIGETFRCGGVDWTIEDAASEILEIGEPVEVYNPSWIKI